MSLEFKHGIRINVSDRKEMTKICRHASSMQKKNYLKIVHVRRYARSRLMKTERNAQNSSLRLGKLLLAEEEQEASTNEKLTEQSHPEPGISQSMGAKRHVRRNGPRAGGIRTEGPGADGCNGTKHLGCNESETHVDSRESLQKNDTEAETLDGIQHAQPQPETAGYQGSGSVSSSPREVVTDSGDTPPNLDEARGSQTTGEDGNEPTVSLGEFADAEQEDAPYYTEEQDAKEDNLPWLGVAGTPEEAPVSAVGCTEEEVLQDNRDEVPCNDLSPEQGLVEGWNLTGLLAVVVGKSKRQDNSNKNEETCNGVTDRTHLPGVGDRVIGSEETFRLGLGQG